MQSRLCGMIKDTGRTPLCRDALTTLKRSMPAIRLAVTLAGRLTVLAALACLCPVGRHTRSCWGIGCGHRGGRKGNRNEIDAGLQTLAKWR